MTFTEIIGLWPSVADMARDLGLPSKNVRRWQDIGSIPAEWFVAVERAAHARGIDNITVQSLAASAHSRRLSRVMTEAANDASEQSVAA